MVIAMIGITEFTKPNAKIAKLLDEGFEPSDIS